MKSTRNPQHARQAFAIKAIVLAVASVFAQGAMADPALPTGGVPTAGTTIGVSGTGTPTPTMTVTQSPTTPRAVIDWTTFNIGNGATVRFDQQFGTTSVAVNRVGLSGGQSVIDGALTANGNVMILNPNGVAFTSNAVVNVAGLIASTGNIDATAFMSSSTAPIAITGATTGSITNQGSITVTNAGLAAFVAPSVTNSGTITASSGRVVLAGAQAATVSYNGLYEIAINQPIAGGTVTNTGTLQATGGSIVLSAEDASSLVSGVINLSGIQQADRIEVNGNHVVLTSGLNAATVTGSSNTIDVQSAAKIRDGVNIAASGGTVNVAAGIYAEQLNITKSLSLVGAGANQTTITPTSLAVDADGMQNILTIGGSSATSAEVSGFTFKGPVPSITAGIFVRDGAHAHIHDNKLIDMRESAPLSGNQRGVGIFVGRAKFGTSGTAVIENNVITGYQKGGIVVDGPGSQAAITGNTVTGEGPTSVIAQNGIQVSRGANATLGGNTVRGNVYTGVSADPDDFAAGILLFTSGPYVGQGGATIGPTNTITDNQFGIWTNDPVTLATINLTGATGNTRNAVAFTSGGYAGQGPLLEYPAWATSNAALVDAGAFAGSLSGDILNAGGAVRVSGWNGFAAIQPAINAVATSATVNVAAGTYAEQVTINKANLTLAGQTGARITVPDLAQVNGVTISANNVTVSGFEIAGPVTSSYLTYPWSNISRGIAVMNGFTGFTIVNNNIHDVRNGILIDGRNTGSVTGNRIENTKSGISVQYTDGSGITISGNSQGPIGNEWGVNLHLNGYWDGTSAPPHPNPISAAPTPAWQQALLNLSAANGGWSVQDQGYTSSNRTHVQVATTGLSTNQGSLLTPLNSVQNGINAAVSGGRVNVAAGTYTQTSTLNVNKSVTLTGAGEGLTTLDARGLTGYGLSVSADNVTLSDFTVYGPSAFFASAYGIKVSPGGSAASRLHNFTITNVTSRGAGKAELDLNGVDGATIDHFTADGTPVGATSGTTQGAGIQLTDSANITVTNSTTRNNAWGGLAIYQANRSYDQQANNITIGASNSFTESNPLFMQNESTRYADFGTLNLPGFSYAVRNPASVGGVLYSQYTWLQPTSQGAYDLAVNLPSPGVSTVQGWSGSARTQDFHVGIGNLTGGGTQAMSIIAAVGTSNGGANIHVGAGTYAENVTVDSLRNLSFNGSTLHSLTINSGASGSGIGGSVTADTAAGFAFNAPVVLASNTTLDTSAVSGSISTGAINGTASGAQALTINAGSGAVSLGDVGSTTQLGATVINGNTVDLTAALRASSLTGNSNTANVHAGARIQDGISIARSGGTVNIAAGTYGENVTVDSLRNLSFNGSTLHSLTINSGASGSGIGGSVTADAAAGFAFNAPVVLLSNTTLGTNGGAVSTGAINGKSAGEQALTINAGSGAVSLGDVGATTRLGTTDVTGAIRLAGSTYSANSLHFAGPATLTQAATTLSTNGGSIALDNAVNGTSAGAQALTINAGAGAVAIGDLGATTRLGATDVTGAISLDGSTYSTDALHFAGPVTLTQATTSIGTNGGNVTLDGAVNAATAGAQALTINAGSGAVSLGDLGAATRLGTSDVTGAIRLNGSTYSADALHFAGPATLTQAATTLSTSGGNVTLDNAINGTTAGGQALTINAGSGAVALANLGASTSLGATVVNGNIVDLTAALQASSLTGSSNTVNVHAGAHIQDGIGIARNGGTVNVAAGTYGENVTVNSLRNLSFNGSTVHSLTINSGASGSGIGGSVTADTAAGFAFNAPVVLLGNATLDTSAAAGAVATEAINGTSAGAQALTINAGSGAVTLGDLGATARLGATDVTGAISLNGSSYSGNSLHFASPVTLTQATTTLATNGGSIAFDGAINGATAGAQALTINAGAGAVTLANLGATTRLGATDVTGTISLAGSTYGADSLHFAGPATLTQATTTLSTSGGNITLDNAINGTTAGAQALTINAATGAVSLGDLGATTRLGATDVTGAISLSGSNFTADSLRFNGAVSLTQSATILGTSGGAVATGTIDGTAAGAQALTINAGSGAVTLANLGATTRLGTTDVTGTTHLAGSTYNADSLHFAGPMTLALPTTFSTSGGNIAISGDIQNAGTTPQALSLHAGTDGTRGDVSLVSGGSQSNPLGPFDVVANNLTLTGTLWVKNYRIDGRGAIALSGNTLIATDAAIANTITAVGDVSGSTVSSGSVQASSTGGDVALNVTAQGTASVSGANVSGNIAGTDVTVAAQNNSSASVTAQGTASITAANVSGSVTGNQVSVSAQDAVNATVTAKGAANVSGASVSGSFSGANVAVAAQDVVNVSVTATGTATIDATNTVQATVNAGSAAVHAGSSANVSGSSSSLTLDTPSGSVSGSFGEVTNVGSGLVNVNGRPQANTTLATNADNNRVTPSDTVILGGTSGGAPGVGLTAIEVPMLPGAVPVSLSSPTRAGEYIMQGRSVEIDLSPRRDEEQK